MIADEEIGSPLVEHPPLAIALNLPSFDKYEELLQPGGTLVVNKSMVDREARRTDIKVVMVPCNQIAEEVGSSKLVNMVAIGALASALPEIGVAALEKALTDHMPARHKDLLAKNHEALRKGFAAAQAQ